MPSCPTLCSSGATLRQLPRTFEYFECSRMENPQPAWVTCAHVQPLSELKKGLVGTSCGPEAKSFLNPKPGKNANK